MVKQHNKATKLWPHEQEKKRQWILKAFGWEREGEKERLCLPFFVATFACLTSNIRLPFLPSGTWCWACNLGDPQALSRINATFGIAKNHTFSLGPLFLCFFSCSSSSWFSFSMRVISVLHRRCNSYVCVCVCVCVYIMTTVCCV